MKMMPSLRIDEGQVEKKREEIRKYFHSTYDTYECLFDCLISDDILYQQPDNLRHPLVFYFGHTATFFVNKLMAAGIIKERIDAHMESTMAIGVDEMSWDDLYATHYDWPQISEVRTYRKMVRDMVDRLISNLDLKMPIVSEDPMWIILMGIEHERIHLETSSVLIRQLPIAMVKEHPLWPLCPEIQSEISRNAMQQVAATKIQLGRAKNSKTYGWDNEYGDCLELVSAFKANTFLVSQSEYLKFVEAGGYQEEEYWSEEGWQWRHFRKAEHPIFWIKDGETFRYRSMLKEIEMPWSWPVEVNYLEAKAYCRWRSVVDSKQYRLPSEAEWHAIVAQCSKLNCTIKGSAAEAIYADRDSSLIEANLGLNKWASSCPVDQHITAGFGDLKGNVWQWTESCMDAFSGFEVHPAYDDFSVPTFDAKHQIMKGGSWISTGNAAEIYSRYAFRRHFFQHAGFRMVESGILVEQKMNTYESDVQIAQYLEFHYGEDYFGVPNFPKACIEKIWKVFETKDFDRALDLGCAVGRSSFELSKKVKHVDALDYSARFIQNAMRLQEQGELTYQICTEGDLFEQKIIKAKNLFVEDFKGQVSFLQGDACNLKSSLSHYDLIFAGNLIDRLYDPKAFLASIHKRLNAGGVFVLTSPYTWLEEFTAKDNWIGGYTENGQNIPTIKGLRKVLGEHFTEVSEPVDVPFVIRETARKHQHTVAQMSFWLKK